MLDDSKRLSQSAREALSGVILARAEQVVVQSASARRIDLDGLHRTNLSLLARAVAMLRPAPDIALIDGFRLPPGSPPHRAVIRGDQTSAAVAAASIIAKTVRDRLMRELARNAHPGYGFEDHVGYGTRAHRAHLASRGPCALHRRSFHWSPEDASLVVELIGETDP
jgi:ribonuclease HII